MHNYKSLHRRGFARSAISVPKHTVKISKIYQEALASPERKEWIKAMVTEMTNQKKKKLYDLVPCVPGQPVIGGKWVFKVKEHPDGLIKKFCARWCTKEYTQKKGQDYTNKMAPVVRSDITRILLSIASVKG